MYAKEVLTHIKTLEANKNNETIVLEQLKVLQKDLVPTEKLLRDTKVGVIVNTFKKSSNKEIVSLVKNIIATWKDQVSKEKKSRTAAPAKTASPAVSSPASSGPKETKKYVATAPRTAKNDGVDCDIHGNKTRDDVIRALYGALAKDSEHPPQAIIAVAIEVEGEINKMFNINNNDKKYKEKYRTIFSNIINKSNPDLKVRIANGELSAHELVTIDPKELAPEHLKARMEEIKKQNLFNAQGANLERSVTDRFTCGKCKEKKVSYYQLQTRSADEPLTTFCTCEVCGNRWKFS